MVSMFAARSEGVLNRSTSVRCFCNRVGSGSGNSVPHTLPNYGGRCSLSHMIFKSWSNNFSLYYIKGNHAFDFVHSKGNEPQKNKLTIHRPRSKNSPRLPLLKDEIRVIPSRNIITSLPVPGSRPIVSRHGPLLFMRQVQVDSRHPGVYVVRKQTLSALVDMLRPQVHARLGGLDILDVVIACIPEIPRHPLDGVFYASWYIAEHSTVSS